MEIFGKGGKIAGKLASLTTHMGGKILRYNLANLALVCTMGWGTAILKSCNLAPLGPLGRLGLGPLAPLEPLAPFLVK